MLPFAVTSWWAAVMTRGVRQVFLVGSETSLGADVDSGWTSSSLAPLCIPIPILGISRKPRWPWLNM